MEKHERTAEHANKSKPSPWQGIQLTLVQSTVCILALLCVLVLKWIGGDVYAALRAQFERAMTEDVLASAMLSTQIVAAEDVVDSKIITDETAAVCAPLNGGVLTSPFGGRDDPFDAEKQDAHHGVDIGADEGTVLYAFQSGVVSEVGYEEHGYGHYMIVTCDDRHSYVYAHCSRIDVQNGQAVKAGEAVALVGSTGRSTGSHLHFEWRENGQAIDPTSVLPEETYV